jgi:mono/diheme cytochrome c family protein
MRRIGRVIGSMGVTASLLAGGHAWAEGNPGAGLALARRICSECHAVERAQERSPNAAAPRFETIANVPGMTGAALSVALQTPHRTMPNVMLDANELSDIVAYILSLRRVD